ncbi:uncharacterized protein BO80DRAFT_87485 [Aspergillus ibericus CBS 121593]|uniref:Uncharacterized protein n=1 Tax=Aspergillus ibericus CBS 121593 TaxID=1448316 RepID=A0A395GZJ2_9EURO|nr:hypothetical protein BO80DRAFT_87485 [Aspergillus ibericus CBS 121593]RAL00753.1 hypothetical protein BO80DRAFT_87485 [Aspergillus ibericus CBS 121593]
MDASLPRWPLSCSSTPILLSHCVATKTRNDGHRIGIHSRSPSIPSPLRTPCSYDILRPSQLFPEKNRMIMGLLIGCFTDHLLPFIYVHPDENNPGVHRTAGVPREH